jgi:T5SS/PEP-CTERM-associated repeat protein
MARPMLHPRQSPLGIAILVLLMHVPCAAQQVVVSDAPNYPYNTYISAKGYYTGCGPTSAVDLLGTYDLRGATDLIASPLDDICLLHESYMNTGVDGFGAPSDFHYGMEDFAQDRGYSVDAVLHVEPTIYDPSDWSVYPYGADHRADANFWNTSGSDDPANWTIDEAKFLDFLAAEIDAGRPVGITVDSGGATGPEHWMVAVGYDRTAEQWAGYNTYDSQLHWYNVDSAWRDGNNFGVAYIRSVEFNGQERKWDGNGGGPDGYFNAEPSWNPDVVPGATDSATFDLDQTYTVYLDVDATNIDANVSLGDVTIRSSGGTHLYTLTGDLTVTTGSNLTVRDMFLIVEEDVCVRDGSTLTVDQSSGVVMSVPAGANVPHVLIADGATSIASVTIDGSYWVDAHTVVVGGFGDGTLDVQNAGLFMCDTAYVARWNGSFSDVTVDGTDSEWWVDGTLYIGGREDGDGGWGSASAENGGLIDAGQIVVWSDSGLACFDGTIRTNSFDNSHGGVFNFTGGTFTVQGGQFDPGTGDFLLAGFQNPALVLEDGATFSEANAQIGAVAGMSGNLTVRGIGTSWICSSFFKVGYEGTGALSVLEGGTVVTNHAWIGDLATGNGQALVEGEGSSWTSLGGGISVGTYGTGMLTIRDGGYVSCPLATVAAVTDSSGVVTIEGADAMWDCTGSFYAGGHISTPGGFGSVSVNQFGTLKVADTLKVWPGGTVGVAGAYALIQADTVELAGGNLNVGTWGTLCANTLVGFGSTPSFGGNLYFGHSGGACSYTIGAGGSLGVSGNLEVGHSSSAILSVNDGGTLWTGTDGGAAAFVGRMEEGNGAVMVTGGDAAWYNDGELRVGYQGIGQVTVSGGAFMSSANAWIGDQSASTGTVTIQGEGSTWNSTGALSIGTYGVGELLVETGASVSCDSAVVGAVHEGDVWVTGEGASWHDYGTLIVGKFGNGEMTVELGGAVWSAEACLGEQDDSEGIVTVRDEDSAWTCNGNLELGVLGEGSLTIGNGGTASCQSVSLGREHGSAGSLDVEYSEVGFQASGSMYVGGDFDAEGGAGHVGVGSLGRVGVGGTMKIWPSGTVNVEDGWLVVDTLEIVGGVFNANTGSDISANTMLGLPDDMYFNGWLTIGHSGGTGVGNHTVTGDQGLAVMGGLIIASDAQGYFSVLNGGTVAAAGTYIGLWAGSSGTVGVAGTDSALSSLGALGIGYEGTGLLTISNGATVSSMAGSQLGVSPGATGTVNVHGGTWANMWDLTVGYYGHGIVSQTAGEVTVGAGTYIAFEADSQGEYSISGGSLSTPGLYVGLGGPGTLSIQDPSADITVQVELMLGPNAILAAVPGAKIHMTGSAFTNQSMDAASVAGLEDLELIFEGGPTDLDPFEVAGDDRGPVLDGFDGNFALGTLRIGGDAIGRVQLVDLIQNQPGPPSGGEALYVYSLILDTGSYLDLNGLNLYCFGFQDLGGTIDANGGQLVQMLVPGDANGDGTVTDADYTIWADHYGQCGVGVAQGDFNGDGCVTDADYTVWADHYGQGAGTGVPEPGAAALVALGAVALMVRRKR